MRRALWCLFFTTVAQAAPSALIVTHQYGTEAQGALRYSTHDGERMAQVMNDLGGFSPGDIATLNNPSPAQVMERLGNLAPSSEGTELFVFYYSGHGDASGLQLGGEHLPIENVLAAVRRVKADVKLVIIDACQSGGATRAKGVKGSEPPVALRVREVPATGEVLVTSSTDDEFSFESDSSQGAVFTHHWVAGLRGAADANGDGQVTLSEVFRYAYDRTVFATLLSTQGPQRPTFSWEMTGRKEPVLARLGDGARLTWNGSATGRLFIFDEADEQLFTEVPVSAGQPLKLMLRPGDYVVRFREPRGVKQARIRLGTRDDRELGLEQMRELPMIRLPRKGALGAWSVSARGGFTHLGLAQMNGPSIEAGVELRTRFASFGLNGEFFTGSTERNGLTISQRGGGPTLSVLAGFQIANVSLRAGPLGGVWFLEQSVTARPSKTGALGLVGGRAVLEVELGERLAVFAYGDALALFGQFARTNQTEQNPEAYSMFRVGLGARLSL